MAQDRMIAYPCRAIGGSPPGVSGVAQGAAGRRLSQGGVEAGLGVGVTESEPTKKFMLSFLSHF